MGASRARGGWAPVRAASAGAPARVASGSLAGAARCARSTGGAMTRNVRPYRPGTPRSPEPLPKRVATVAGWPSRAPGGAARPVTCTGAAMAASDPLRPTRCGLPVSAGTVGSPPRRCRAVAADSATSTGTATAWSVRWRRAPRPPRAPVRHADNSPEGAAEGGASPATCTGIGMAASARCGCGSAEQPRERAPCRTGPGARRPPSSSSSRWASRSPDWCSSRCCSGALAPYPDRLAPGCPCAGRTAATAPRVALALQ